MQQNLRAAPAVVNAGVGDAIARRGVESVNVTDRHSSPRLTTVYGQITDVRWRRRRWYVWAGSRMASGVTLTEALDALAGSGR